MRNLTAIILGIMCGLGVRGAIDNYQASLPPKPVSPAVQQMIAMSCKDMAGNIGTAEQITRTCRVEG